DADAGASDDAQTVDHIQQLARNFGLTTNDQAFAIFQCLGERWSTQTSLLLHHKAGGAQRFETAVAHVVCDKNFHRHSLIPAGTPSNVICLPVKSPYGNSLPELRRDRRSRTARRPRWRFLFIAGANRKLPRDSPS